MSKSSQACDRNSGVFGEMILGGSKARGVSDRGGTSLLIAREEVIPREVCYSRRGEHEFEFEAEVEAGGDRVVGDVEAR